MGRSYSEYRIIFSITLLLQFFVYFQIYPDSEVQTEVMNSHVRCKYYKEGCRWVDKLQNLQVIFGYVSLLSTAFYVCTFKLYSPNFEKEKGGIAQL